MKFIILTYYLTSTYVFKIWNCFILLHPSINSSFNSCDGFVSRKCNCMSVAKRVRSIVYAPLFHRGCTFALKHMCTKFYDANHAKHGTNSVIPLCRWSRFCANNKFQNCVFNPSQTRCQFNWETLSRFKRMKLYISNVPYSLVEFPPCNKHWAHDINCDVSWYGMTSSSSKGTLTLESSIARAHSLFRLSDRSRGSCQVDRGGTIIRGKDYFAYSHGAAVRHLPLVLGFFKIAGRAEKWRRKGRPFASAPIGPSRLLQAQL